MTWGKNQKIKYPCDKHPKFVQRIPRQKNTWSASSNNKLKGTIKYHYSIVQDDKCAYCRQPLRFDGYGEPIEHIVPKAEKFKWMFHPINLCLACYGCNTKKGTQNTLVNDFSFYGDGYSDFPNNSKHYKIVHPHFDSYSNHIIEEKFICKPKNNSTKGSETIRICGLNRFDLIYTRARHKNNSKKQLQRKLTSVVSDNSFRLEERKSAQKMINKIIERYNYLTFLKA